MTKRQQRRERLERRLLHLQQRIFTGNYLGDNLSFDKAEASALKWVLEREELLKEACIDLLHAMIDIKHQESAILKARQALQFGDIYSKKEKDNDNE